MKVNAWKNLDIECEVEVSLDHCIDEMLCIATEEGMPNRKSQAIDGATKILERITPDMIGEKLATNPKAIELIRQRLEKWLIAIAKASGL